MADRHDPRYVDSEHPEAVYRAWAHGTVDMGGWTERDSLDAFRMAIRDEHQYGAGEELPDEALEIEATGDPTRRLLSMLTLTLADISERSGIPLDTLKSWSSGRTTPREDGRRQLSAWVRQHADALEREARATPGGGEGDG